MSLGKQKLKPGSYVAKAIGFTFSKSANKGTNYVEVVFLVENSHLYENPKVSWKGFFTDKMKERVLTSLRSAGWNGQPASFRTLTGLGSVSCSVDVAEESYTKEDGTVVKYLKVDWVNPLTRSLPMGNREMDEFEQSMQGFLFEHQAKHGSEETVEEARGTFPGSNTDFESGTFGEASTEGATHGASDEIPF